MTKSGTANSGDQKIVSVTAQKIRDISDAGEFETLAIRVLRQLDSDCAPLVHLGINSSGKTIVSPIDGFARVPGSSPSKYVTAAFTTVAPNKLEQKWLNTGTKIPQKAKKRKRRAKRRLAQDSERGDLIKAAEAASKLRATDPDGKFIVYLCTNQGLSDQLMQKTLAEGQRLNVEVRFLEQTRLRDFLDTKPEGQWLRKQHLGIEADQVSLELLREAAAHSLAEYSKSILLVPAREIITTTQIEGVLEAVQDRTVSLQLLVGPSGMGKSVIGVAAHQSALNNGRIAFWIPEHVVEKAISVADALNIVLRASHPNLPPDAGLTALQIGSTESPLILIIDDINRTAAPANALQRVIRWSRPQPQGQQTSNPVNAQQIICPVWPSYWAMVFDRELRSWARVDSIQPFTHGEAVQYLKTVLTGGARFADTHFENAADILKSDPILLALYADTMLRNPQSNPLAVAHDVIGTWSNTILRELSDKSHKPLAMYRSSLAKLAREMIMHRALRPSVSDLEVWFKGSEIQQHILGLAESGHLCRIREFKYKQTIEFRHDRILEFFISEALIGMLQEKPDPPELWDPFFTPFLGRAVAQIPLSDTILDSIEKHNPVSLIAAIPFLDIATSENATAIKHRAHQWLKSWQSLRTVWHYSLSLLREVTSSAVLEVTDGLAGNHLVYLARLRNGDVQAAIRELSFRFFPGVNAPWMEGLIAEARHYHESQMIDSLSQLLTSNITGDLSYGALVLAGYIGSVELTTAIATCWNQSSDKAKIIGPALWAILRCIDKNPEEIMRSMFSVILEIEHDPSGKSPSPRYYILQELGFAGRHGYRKEALHALLTISESEEYVSSVMSIAAELMDAVVVPYVVQRLAESSHRARQSGGFSFFAHSWIDRWRRWRDQGQTDLQCLSVLQQIWMNKSEAEWVREYAFKAWNAATTDLTTLQAIEKTDVLYEDAVWHRMMEGDRNASPVVLELLPHNPFWFQNISKIWGSDFEEVLRQHIEQFVAAPPSSARSNADYDLAHLLRDIPEDVAEKVLVTYWDKLRQRPLFIQLALYLATDQSRLLAANAVNDLGGETFVHIDSFFGIHTVGLADRLRLKHFESLTPYLHYLSDMTISDMIDWCGKSSNLSWARTNLLPEYQRRRSITPEEDHRIISHSVRHWLASSEEVFEELDEIVSANPSSQAFRLERMSEQFLERGDALEAFCTNVKNWFLVAPSGERFAILATVIQHWGRRSDLPFLESMYSAYASGTLPTFSDLKFSIERRSID